ncbi:putative histidine kinase [Methanocella paludicola SANAE]|uniref:histidine kinase n=1 Tax=Methanocella paludicola (strain DSM 17711 / JCM 13418 / NBRC 101707 / SANAE) TaxID=304371 RepID=D1YYD8_METPS|nr:cache domain-containing protein [Methanocella paludicola]BAI61460.1 putative histidine kinase [Methanocella paludicola SANAE]
MASIKVKVIVLVLLMILPIILIGAAGTLYFQYTIRQTIWDDNLAQAKAISAMTPEYMGASQLYLTSIADRPLVVRAMENGDTAFLTSMAAYANSTERINSVYFTDKNGTVLAATAPLSGLIGTSAVDRPYVNNVTMTGMPYIGDTEPGIDRTPVVAIGVPVKNNNGTVIGVMVGTIDLDDYAKTVLGTQVKNQQYIYLVNRTGHIIVHNNPQYVLEMRDYTSVPAVQRVLNGETGVMENHNPVENDDRLAAYTPIKTLGWGVIVAIPVNVAYEPVRNATTWMVAIVATTVILSMILGLYVGNGITSPITKLSTAVKMAGESENYRHMLPLGRDDEIGELARSFSGMMDIIKKDIEELKRTGDALRKGQHILTKSQEVAHVGNWAWNVQTGELTGSPECDRIFGYEPGQVRPSHNWAISRVHPDDRKIMEGLMETAIRTGKRGGADYRIVRPDGTIRYVNTIVDKIVHDKAGKVKWLYGISQDITERKQAEESMKEAKQRAELYLDLMGHDINNINQVAMGYLELANDRLPLSEEEKELISTPLDALKSSARLIENVRKLQRSKEGDLKTEVIDMGDVLSDVRDDYLRTSSDSIVIRYEKKESCHVLANSLIRDVFGNLIGNAIKHSEGRKPVEIDIRQDTMVENGKDYCRVAIEDNGPGIPDQLKQKLFHRFQRGDTHAHGKGLGLYLVRTLVEDYHGRAWVEDRVPGDHTKGSRFVVILPLAGN